MYVCECHFSVGRLVLFFSCVSFSLLSSILLIFYSHAVVQFSLVLFILFYTVHIHTQSQSQPQSVKMQLFATPWQRKHTNHIQRRQMFSTKLRMWTVEWFCKCWHPIEIRRLNVTLFLFFFITLGSVQFGLVWFDFDYIDRNHIIRFRIVSIYQDCKSFQTDMIRWKCSIC